MIFKIKSYSQKTVSKTTFGLSTFSSLISIAFKALLTASSPFSLSFAHISATYFPISTSSPIFAKT